MRIFFDCISSFVILSFIVIDATTVWSGACHINRIVIYIGIALSCGPIIVYMLLSFSPDN